MSCRLRPVLPIAIATALAFHLQLFVTTASAHIELQQPLNRYSDVRSGANEACPCGSGTTSRRCSNPADLSDDGRSPDRITTFAPGDTITVRFSEYVGHSGRYRVAFDADGADLADFNQNVLLDEPDPGGATGNIGQGTLWELQVTLPDITCDRCTLQLMQVIDGNTLERVLDPATRGEAYFQCADLILADGTPPGGIPPANPGKHMAELSRPTRGSSAPAPAETPAADAPTAGGSSVPAATDGSTSTGATPGASDDGVTLSSPASSDGGCTLAPLRPARGSLPALGALALCIVTLLGRRRTWLWFDGKPPALRRRAAAPGFVSRWKS